MQIFSSQNEVIFRCESNHSLFKAFREIKIFFFGWD